MDNACSHVWPEPREVISVHLGQAGVQAGARLWELYCAEHGVDPSTGAASGAQPTQLGLHKFFFETSYGHHNPSAIMIDTDPATIADFSHGNLRNIFGPNQLLSGKEDAGNNFARGYLGERKHLKHKVVEALRKFSERCDNVQGFCMQHAMGGGTGSGFCSLLVEELTKSFPKKDQIQFSIYPSPQIASSTVEPYNALLFTHCTRGESSGCCFLTDNQALYNICSRKLDLDVPSYVDLNRLLAQTVSTVTSSFRFESTLNATFRDLMTNLIPFPSLRFPLVTYAPIIGPRKADHEIVTTADITYMCFKPSNHMVVCDSRKGVYMAVCLVYRGDVSPREVNQAALRLSLCGDVPFAGWVPNAFKIGISGEPPRSGGDRWGLSVGSKAACSLANTTSIVQAWRRLSTKFATMYRKKAFLHWFLQEGLEQHNFESALETVYRLEMDYREAAS